MPPARTTTYYFGSYEELVRPDAVTERRHWIVTPDGTAGIHTSRSDGSNASRYWLTDHLGQCRRCRRPGRIRRRRSRPTRRGATRRSSHRPIRERRIAALPGTKRSLAELSLINMNGRVYDPCHRSLPLPRSDRSGPVRRRSPELQPLQLRPKQPAELHRSVGFQLVDEVEEADHRENRCSDRYFGRCDSRNGDGR